MFGLTTSRRARHLEAQLAETGKLLINSYGAHIEDIAVARRRDAQLRARLARALRGCARWRAAAGSEHRSTEVLAGQLLDATSGTNTAARTLLGLPVDGPWQRAVDGLNALVDADVVFHIEPDGHISNPMGDEHIQWNRAQRRWELAHDDETSLTA
ncbi:hypothetical protein [Streptomyces parvulus]